MEAERKKIKQHKPLPAPNGDFYELVETLPAEELAIVKRLGRFPEERSTKSDELTRTKHEEEFEF